MEGMQASCTLHFKGSKRYIDIFLKGIQRTHKVVVLINGSIYVGYPVTPSLSQHFALNEIGEG